MQRARDEPQNMNCLCIRFLKVAAPPKSDAFMMWVWCYWKCIFPLTLKCFNVTYIPIQIQFILKHTHHDDEHSKCQKTLNYKITVSNFNILH